jgi:hypothetical protein
MSDINKTLSILHQPGEIIEIRIPKAGFKGKEVYAGFFDDPEKCFRTVEKYSGVVPAIYTNLNPINPALLARANNRIDEKAGLTAQDTDVLKRSWLYIDIDPVRPAGISSTDNEHDEAITKANEINQQQLKAGWGAGIVCDSGNGASLLFKIDLTNNEVNTNLIKKVLSAFDFLYSNNTIQIDTSVFNPARIIKLYGTATKKGDSIIDRPHRISKLLSVPEKIDTISTEQLIELAAKVPEEQEQTTSNQSFNIQGWMKEHNLTISKSKTWNGGMLYVLDECPFDSNHKSPDACIIQGKSGALGFKCLHNSCRTNDWQALRRLKEPDRVKQPLPQYNNNNNSEALPEIHTQAERRLKLELPEDHFISEYVRWLSSLSDGYVDYQILCGFWLLSALTKGRVFLRLKQELIKPNIWGICVGASTTSRKSTIVNKTRNIFEIATDTILYNDDYSIEGYLETLSHFPISNHVRDEAAGLFAKFHKRYNEGIFEAECAIYDCQSYKKTLASGKDKKPKTFEIDNPYVTKLYATTPDNLARYLTIDDFLSGYGYRLLYALPNYKHDRMPLEVETLEDIGAWAAIMKKVKTINQTFQGLNMDMSFSVEPEAMRLYNEILENLEVKADATKNDMLNSVIGRAQVHILKLAMLIELGKNTMSRTITVDSIVVASNMVVDYFIPSIMEVLDRLSEDIRANKIEKLRAIIRRLGGTATHTKLLRDSHLTSKEFLECINTMIESQEINIDTEKGRLKLYKLNNHNKPLNIMGKDNAPKTRPDITKIIQERMKQYHKPIEPEYMEEVKTQMVEAIFGEFQTIDNDTSKNDIAKYVNQYFNTQQFAKKANA